jgi:proteic killer suppression protein
MILDFGDETTEDIYHGDHTKAARRIPTAIWKAACRKLDRLNAAHELRDLAVPPGNRLEALKGRLAGCHSVRINDQFRLVFKWMDGNAREVRMTDDHELRR